MVFSSGRTDQMVSALWVSDVLTVNVMQCRRPRPSMQYDTAFHWGVLTSDEGIFENVKVCIWEILQSMVQYYLAATSCEPVCLHSFSRASNANRTPHTVGLFITLSTNFIYSHCITNRFQKTNILIMSAELKELVAAKVRCWAIPAVEIDI